MADFTADEMRNLANLMENAAVGVVPQENVINDSELQENRVAESLTDLASKHRPVKAVLTAYINAAADPKDQLMDIYTGDELASKIAVNLMKMFSGSFTAQADSLEELFHGYAEQKALAGYGTVVTFDELVNSIVESSQDSIVGNSEKLSTLMKGLKLLRDYFNAG